ncbi:MAG: helix-turn-helix domain-containing protein [Proteobacteria bacterium]|nr:helix-turn-helix domain-containing protein [Pseudomonadota bacterium]
MKNTLPDKLFFRPSDVAHMFDISVKTVYGWIETGKLRAIRITDRTLRIPRAAIEKILKETDE